MIKSLSEFFLRQFVNNYPATGLRKIYTTFCFYMRNALVKYFNDPVIDHELGGKKVKMNLSYNLPILLKDRPYYNSCLPRLSRFVRERQGRLVFIDIGANIGDTAILISEVVPDGRYLCVEASDFYYRTLEENTKIIKGITPVKVLCDENESQAKVSLDVIGDSAVVSKTGGSEMRTTTIDRLVSEHPDFKNTNILKIDTDGYDFRIIRGAAALIDTAKPVLFFEFSPNHLIDAGEDPVSIFPYLAGKGYADMLLYDRFGYLYMKIGSSETDLLARLIDYTIRKKGEYFDVLAFHSSAATEFNLFFTAEKQFFTKAIKNK
jgi:FkbM family methyltransferase